jgi:hypothetical protein
MSKQRAVTGGEVLLPMQVLEGRLFTPTEN